MENVGVFYTDLVYVGILWSFGIFYGQLIILW
jgi:hypothetical protein